MRPRKVFSPRKPLAQLLRSLTLSLAASTAFLTSNPICLADERPIAPQPECAFAGEKAILIACAQLLHESPKGSVVLLPGYSESLRKYDEIAQELWRKGFSVFILDHRGQGESGRLHADPRIAEIDDFSFFASDLHTFLKLRVRPQSKGPIFLIGHSLGGAIAASYLERYPFDFDKAVLTAPMFEIDLHGWPLWFTRLVLSAAALIGKETSPLFNPIDPGLYKFEENELTRSRVRFEHDQQLLSLHPKIVIWGRTRRWLSQALAACRQISANAAAIKTPVLILQAADDTFVKNKAQSDFCEKLNSCRLEVLPHAKHEILREVDDVRAKAVEQITAFLSRR